MPITNGRYVNPGWVNGQPPAINASELNAVSDTLERLTDPGGRRGGYVVVGTSTKGATAFDCDFLCDGTADDVEINAAIEMAKTLNLGVFLLPGTYNITDTIILFGEMCGSPAANTILTRTSVSFDYLIQMRMGSYLHDILTDSSSNDFESSSTAEIYAYGENFIQNVAISSAPYIGILSIGDSSNPSGSFNSIRMDNVSTFPGTNTVYSFQLTHLTSEADPCYIRNCVFSNASEILTSAISYGVFVSGNLFKDLTISNCSNCSIYGNNFSGNLSLSGSASPLFSCTSNIINSNAFLGGHGITLGENTQKNLVTGNGGGNSNTQWAGVTDNGSNNYVANNMPTS